MYIHEYLHQFIIYDTTVVLLHIGHLKLSVYGKKMNKKTQIVLLTVK
jgi:hypothetical protein